MSERVMLLVSKEEAREKLEARITEGQSKEYYCDNHFPQLEEVSYEQVSQGQTIIEKFETHTNVGFGVVLYTPCDVGAVETDRENLQPRARQNVVLEHGFLIGKLGRENVAALVKGDIEKPNDISGVVYVSMESNNWQLPLVKELSSAGYDVDMKKLLT